MRHDDTFLVDMLLATREARKFADDLTFMAFEQNRMAQLAILKAAEIVAEAASRVSPEGKEAHPEVPWPRIVGMRNRLVHGYFNLNLQRVWETVQEDIPRLIPNWKRWCHLRWSSTLPVGGE
jgi:uncharacterized protein with HEPN domain